MASLVDVDNSGDAKRAVEQLTEEAAAQKTATAVVAAKPEPSADDSGEEARFRGKSREDILAMYHNLESHQGRLASELGQTRRTVDEILLQKRRDDLSTNGAVDDFQIDPADMLTKPKEVLDRYVDAKAKALIEPTVQRLNNLEQTLLTTSFQTRHADSSTVTATPQFKNWVRETPLRQQLAQNAANGSVQAADALMTEYKAAKPQGKNLEAALDQASKVTLEGARASESGAGGGAAGKKYKRGDLMKLRQQDPDKYDSLGPEIYKAYQEGRVVG